MNEQNEQNEEKTSVQEVIAVAIGQIAIGLMLRDVPDDVLEGMFNQIAVINRVPKTIFLSAFDGHYGIDYIRELGEQWVENSSYLLSNVINAISQINDNEAT